MLGGVAAGGGALVAVGWTGVAVVAVAACLATLSLQRTGRAG